MAQGVGQQIVNHLPETGLVSDNGSRSRHKIDSEDDTQRIREGAEPMRNLADRAADIGQGRIGAAHTNCAFRTLQHRFDDTEEMPRSIANSNDVAVIALIFDGAEVTFRHDIGR